MSTTPAEASNGPKSLVMRLPSGSDMSVQVIWVQPTPTAEASEPVLDEILHSDNDGNYTWDGCGCGSGSNCVC